MKRRSGEGKRSAGAGGLRRFARDRSGSVTVDFIVSLPILLAILVLTSEYGRTLQMRMTLESAVADAARYLSRAPLVPGGDAFPPEAVAIARNLIVSRVPTPHLAISDPALGEVDGRRTVGISAAAGVESPALGLLAIMAAPEAQADLDLGEVEGLIVTAVETVVHFGR